MINTEDNNTQLPLVVDSIANWHKERNLIDGATALSQTGKLLEEFTELVAAQFPDKSADFIYDEIVSMLNDLHERKRIKPVKAINAEEAFKDAIGDMVVVQINLAEREQMSLEECVTQSYFEIEHRKGKMINGVFVKEEDLGTA